MTEPPKFKFLDDDCAKVDLTEDKTHQRIADQLHDLIVSGHPDGMTIGLEGDWGSGKSTVVELLRQKFEPGKRPENFFSRLFHRGRKQEKGTRTVFFYIDAWEHEGDPLRRAFLEALIEKFEKAHATKQPVLSWKTRRKLREIRDKVSAKKTATRLTGLGITMAAAGLLVPIGAELIATFASHVTLQNTGQPCWGFITGVALCLAPAIAFVIVKVVQKIFFRSGKRSSAIFSTEKSMDISLENERTSLEFSRYFHEILAAIKDDFGRIVMVLDNLDRIGQEDALRIWSTLQTFVQRKNPLGEQKKGIAKWIIVPYAEEGLGRIWGDELENTKKSIENTKEKGEKIAQRPREVRGESQGAKRIHSFMDKTFDLRIHVPNMILGDWQTFAKDCILKIEPKFSSSNVETILSALVWTRKHLEDAPSPRQIKLYVNHVLLLCQLHRGRVSLDAICFYVITRYLDEGLTDEEIKKALVNGEINKDSFPPYSGPLVSEMAAIVFNTDKKRAVRLLLETTLRTILGNRNIDSLQTYKKRFGDVFDDVFGHILTQASSRDFAEFIALLQRTSSGMSERLYGYVFQRMKTELEAISRNISLLGHANALALIELAMRDQALSLELAQEYISGTIYSFSHSVHFVNGVVAEPSLVSQQTSLLQQLSDVKKTMQQDVKISYENS